MRAEFGSLPQDATLAPHDLDAETVDRVREIVRVHGKRVKRAYLVRRILKADASLHDYVLAFETGAFALSDKSRETIDALAAQPFPVKSFIVHLGAESSRKLRKSIKRLAVGPMFER